MPPGRTTGAAVQVRSDSANEFIHIEHTIMTADDFLQQMAQTANALDLEAHMNLISKDVRVLGMPGFDVIGYEDWRRQCEHEFANRILKQVSYQGMHVVDEGPERIVFKSVETVEGTDGTVNTHAIEFVIQREGDGQWRVVQERVLPMYELESIRQ